MAFAEEAELQLRGPNQAVWLKQLTAEHDNLRAALRWAENVETRLRFAGALWRFWFMCGHFSEGRGYLEDMQTLLQVDPKISTKALNGAGVLATRQGDYTSARRLHEQCLELQRAQGNALGVAHSLSNLGSVLFNLEDYSGSSTLFEEGLAAYRELDNAEGVALTLNNLGAAALHDERLETALACFAESLEIHQRAGDVWKMTAANFNLGYVAAKRRSYIEARQRFKECILTWNDINEYSCIAECLLLLGWIATSQSEDEKAACLLGVSDMIRDTLRITLNASDIALEKSCKSDLLARMGEQAFTQAWTMGKTMSLEEGVAYALKEL